MLALKIDRESREGSRVTDFDLFTKTLIGVWKGPSFERQKIVLAIKILTFIITELYESTDHLQGHDITKWNV